MSRTLRILSPALATALFTLGFSGVLHADTTERDEQSVRVSYADLNVNSDVGAKQLYGRIQRAAGQVCGVQTGPSALGQQARRNCMSEAIGNAVNSVRFPALTAVYEANGSGRTVVASSR